MESTFPKDARDSLDTRSGERIPTRERSLEPRPHQRSARQVRLQCQRDVERLVQRVGLVTEIILRRTVRTVQQLSQLSEPLLSASIEGRSDLHDRAAVGRMPRAAPRTPSTISGGTELPISSYAFRRHTIVAGKVIASGIPCSRAYFRTDS